MFEHAVQVQYAPVDSFAEAITTFVELIDEAVALVV